MEPLIIEKTDETPRIILDAGQNKFVISDTSWPEDANKFYLPILQWLEGYFQNPNKETIFEFRMEYFNTASAKQIARVLAILQKNSEIHSVIIKWYYDREDLDMSNAGVRYSKLLKMNFELIEKTGKN